MPIQTARKGTVRRFATAPRIIALLGGMVVITLLIGGCVLLGGNTHTNYVKLDRIIKRLDLDSLGTVLYFKHWTLSDSFSSRPEVLAVMEGNNVSTAVESRLEANGFTHLGLNQWVTESTTETAYVDNISVRKTFTTEDGKKIDVKNGGASLVIVQNTP